MVIPPVSRRRGAGPAACPTGYKDPDTGACVTPGEVHFVEGHGLPNSRTLGRNTLFAGSTNNWDAILAKTLAIWETKKLEFRCEASNAFNHPQFVQVPNTDVVNAPPGQFLNPEFTDGGIRSVRMQLKFFF